jgi:hypothetical protein
MACRHQALKSQIARHPPKEVLGGLPKALDAAEQEQIESDWHECVAAIRAVRPAK